MKLGGSLPLYMHVSLLAAFTLSTVGASARACRLAGWLGWVAAEPLYMHVSCLHPLQVDVQLRATRECYVDIAATAVGREEGEEGHRGMAHLAALSAAAVSALTVYDMCKASSKSMVIHNLRINH